MGDILLAVMMLVTFTFGYFAVDRFGEFMAKNYYYGYQEAQIRDMQAYIIETEGKNSGTISKETNIMSNSLSDHDEAEIIVCKMVAPNIIEYLEKSGCTIKFDFRQ